MGRKASRRKRQSGRVCKHANSEASSPLFPGYSVPLYNQLLPSRVKTGAPTADHSAPSPEAAGCVCGGGVGGSLRAQQSAGRRVIYGFTISFHCFNYS